MDRDLAVEAEDGNVTVSKPSSEAMAGAKVELGELGAEIKHRLPALRALTSLRFFAAMHVVIYHLASGHISPRIPLLGNLIGSGYTGVSLFFILSGFILAYNYNDRAAIDRREFWISRFARIYPVYVIALLLGFAWVFAPASPVADHLLLRLGLSATLLQTWYPPFAGSFNGPGWTLSVEAFFYALFPFLLVWMRRVGDLALTVFCAVYVAALGVPVLMHAVAPASHAAFDTAYYLTWGTLPLVHLPMFVIGIYLGIRYLKQGEPRSSWPLLLGGTGSLVLLCLDPTELYAPLRKAFLVVTYAGLIYGLASVRRGWMTNRWMVLGGEISFSIYILQMPVMRAVLGVTRRFGVRESIADTLVLLVLVGLSFLAYRFIELPARVAIRSRLTHRPVALSRI
jgi:peptidoglycan/LPS O-acetylase OafA/YrhL